MRKYKVLRKYPKPFINANRLVMLNPNSTVILKYEKMVKDLLLQGILSEVIEIPKKKIEKKVIKKIKSKIKESTLIDNKKQE